MKANIINLTYNIDREEFKYLVKNTILIKELIDSWNEIVTLWTLLQNTKYWYTASALKEWNVKFIRITDLKDNSINLDTVPFCDCKKYEDYLVKKGDILIWRTGTVWKSFLLDYELPVKSIYASYLIRLRVNLDLVLPEFVYLFLNSYYFWNQLHEIKSWAVKMNINANKIKWLSIPYCSIEKQKKIINKQKTVDQNLENILEKISNIHLIDDSTKKNKNYITQLKQSILQEAIEGKLTKDWREKNKDVEPASVLLERIKTEKEELIKQKKLKKQIELDSILSDQIPFDVPKNWKWVRLWEIWKIVWWWTPKTSFPEYFTPSEIPWLTPADLKWNKEKYVSNWRKYISNLWLSKSSAQLLPKWTVLFSSRAPIWYVRISDKELSTNQWFKSIVPFINISSEYIYYFLLKSWKEIDKKATWATFKEVSWTEVSRVLFPLPPFEEQKEIVKRVDELMRLCDELESQTNEIKDNSENLMKAVLWEVFAK